MSHRIERVNGLIQREVASAILRLVPASELDPATVTVTRVQTSPDLHTARVFISLFGDDFATQRSMAALQRHRKQIQAHVAKTVVMKFTPRLEFIQDISIEKGSRVLEILDHLDQKHPPGTPSGDHLPSGDEPI